MAAAARSSEEFGQALMMKYLVSMARMVEASLNRSLEALLTRDQKLASEVFLAEPRVNEMEMAIDAYAVRLLRGGGLADEDLRLIVATLKINNDLERIGDLAVNIGMCVISLGELGEVEAPPELAAMTAAVREMISKSLGALVTQDATLANQVLEGDELVDQYRDRIFEQLLTGMQRDLGRVAPNLYFVLASRHLERIADHATNIAEDIIFWVRGQEVRHGRAKQNGVDPTPKGDPQISRNALVLAKSVSAAAT
jgi:phosphate transport system protein